MRILNDLVGCMTYSKVELDELRKAGAQVGSDISQLARVNYRNHRKITVIDAEIGHSGGFNIGQEYIDGGKRFPAWRDTGIRMTGPGVADLEKLFDMRWYEVFGEDLFLPGYYPDASLPPGDTMVQTIHQGYDDPVELGDACPPARNLGGPEPGPAPVAVPGAGPDHPRRPHQRGVGRRGGGLHDDRLAGQARAVVGRRVLLRAAPPAGVRIWLWEKGFFHAKTLTVDGEVCSIGTLNLDMRSLRINKELMIWVYDEAVARKSERLFQDDLRDCRELTLEEVRAWSRPRRFRNSSARLLSNLL